MGAGGLSISVCTAPLESTATSLPGPILKVMKDDLAQCLPLGRGTMDGGHDQAIYLIRFDAVQSVDARSI